jgi:superfamily II DNA or RNA helicase
VLIIDEAHHAVSQSYRRLIDYYRQNPDLKVLGVTATPDRGDNAALKQVFESVAFDYEILDAIEDGWLVPIEQQFVGIRGLDYSRVKTTAGDLNSADLAAVMEAESNLQGIAAASIEIIGQRRSLVFTASVRQARMLAEIYNRHQPRMAQFVCGLTPKDDRRMILADFATGLTQVVVNCGVLTEGFDDPGVECVVMGRATKSRSLYAQQIGRCTRPLPGLVETPIDAEARKAAIAQSAKPNCLVLDFVGNSGRHKLVTAADILGGDISEDVIQLATYKAKMAGRAVSVSRLLDEAEMEVEARKRKEHEERRLAAEARRARLTARANWTAQTVDPFDMFNLAPIPVSNAPGPRLSDRQRDLLVRHMGINPDPLPYGRAMQLLREIFRRWDKGLCTFKQAKWLSKNAYDPAEMTKEEASAIMSRWASNGWRRPKEE